MRRLGSLLAALTLAACVGDGAGTEEAWWAPGPPRALGDCEVRSDAEGSMVGVACPSEDPGPDIIRERLIAEHGLVLIPGGPLLAGGFRPSGRIYWFAVDTGVRPLRFPPNFPASTLVQGNVVAACMARFDLTPEGATSNICVACNATDAAEDFEASVREAISRWIYAPEGSAETGERRTGIRMAIPFERADPGKEKIVAPAMPESACPAEGEG